MKKTLITLAALAMASVASADYATGVTISNGLYVPTGKVNTQTMTGLTFDGAHASAYTFSFTYVSPVTTDTLVATYWNDYKSYGGSFAFIVDSETQALNVNLGSINNGTWSNFDNDSNRRATFTDSTGSALTLTSHTEYTVTLAGITGDDNSGYMTTATLRWTDAAGVDQTASVTYKGNMNGTNNNLGSIGLVYVPEPATATLSLLALAGLAARRRRK